MRFQAQEDRSPFTWHRWFAWYPVRIGNELVWLENVEQRRVPSMVGTGDLCGTEYRHKTTA